MPSCTSLTSVKNNSEASFYWCPQLVNCSNAEKKMECASLLARLKCTVALLRQVSANQMHSCTRYFGPLKYTTTATTFARVPWNTVVPSTLLFLGSPWIGEARLCPEH